MNDIRKLIDNKLRRSNSSKDSLTNMVADLCDGLWDSTPFAYETRFVLNGYDQVQLSANGSVIVEYMQDGEKVRNTYSELSDTYIPIPAGVEVTVYGAVTVINSDELENIFASLDVSKNVALTELDCIGCTGLTSLDVSKNIALTNLNCVDCTGLSSLDVSKNTALTDLDCSGCTSLTSLYLSKNTALTYLSCENCTSLISLDVSKNTALTNLGCSGCTSLTSLDVSKNTALTDFGCVNCTGLTSLDVSNNTALNFLYCSGCKNLLMLDIKNTALLRRFVILDPSMANLTTLKVAGTSAWAYGEVENWLNGDAPANGTIYVDENTPQSVITAAKDKDWEVVYIS